MTRRTRPSRIATFYPSANARALRAVSACLLLAGLALASACATVSPERVPTTATPVPTEVASPTPVPFGEVIGLEAEEGRFRGVDLASLRDGYSGDGYLTGFDAGSDTVVVEFAVARAGRYDLEIRCAAPEGGRSCYLELNGVPIGSVDLAASERFVARAVEEVVLAAGTNRILLYSGEGGYDLDGFRLVPVALHPSAHGVSADPVDPDASAAVRGLMGFLVGQYGKTILSGQADIGKVPWILEMTGKKPAVVAFDMMRYSPSMVERGTTSDEVERAIAWAKEGGIVSFQWHWNAPAGLVGTPGKEWYRGFYADATTFDFAAALADPASEAHALLLRDIDAIAAQLQRLEDAGVPVLWRPLHEASGGWFWWGSRGADACIELYRLLFDRLAVHHGLHNLLWVWSSPDSLWYPGDDVVDIIGFDSYPAGGDHGPVSGRYSQLRQIVGDAKLVAMTENGAIPDPDLLISFQADWSWFMTWGEFVSDGTINDLEHVRFVYGHPRVLTLDELPDLYAAG